MLKFRISFIAILLLTFLFMTSCVKTPTEFYVCDAGNPIFIGKYVASKELMDKSPVFYNEKDMAIFRNNKFWYMGNLEPWPPETHYRCVQIEGCNYDVEYPPTTFDGQWTGTKQYGIDPVPIITTRPCASESIIDSAASPDL